MTLPADGTAWPPPAEHGRYRRMRRNLAWYSGDPDALRAEYAGTTSSTTGGAPTTLNPQGSPIKRVASSVVSWFWGSQSTTELDSKRHLPLAQDVCTISSELLFSERPIVTVLGPTYPADGPVGADGKPQWSAGDPTPETTAAQQRLDDMLETIDFHSTLLASAEVASAAGSAGLRLVVDTTGPVKTQPMIVRVDAPDTFAEYQWAQLSAVTVWEVVRVDGAKAEDVYRHLEQHVIGTGKVFHALYKGTADNIGKRLPLGTITRFQQLEAQADSEGAIQLVPSGGVTAVSIPNILPDPVDLKNNAGRSDFTPAVLDLFDAADKMYSQMMDEIDDAKSRLFMADSMLRDNGAGKGLSFDPNARLFHKVKVPPSQDADSNLPIEQVQFDMRIDQYLAGIDAITAKAVRAAGFNAQTMGDEATGPMTATEFSGRNRRSMSTRDKKSRYWLANLGRLLTSMLEVDVATFETRAADGSRITAWPVRVTLPDVVQPTTLELAATAKALSDAKAASTFTLVREVHPEWSEQQVNDEVDKITEATQAVDPVTLGVAGQGVGAGDGI